MNSRDTLPCTITHPLSKIYETHQESGIIYILAGEYGSKKNKHGQTFEYQSIMKTRYIRRIYRTRTYQGCRENSNR